MDVEKNLGMLIQPIAPLEMTAKEKSNLFYTSEGYQRILDYRVAEILITAVVFGTILFVRLRH
jgi:hypothetical protein